MLFCFSSLHFPWFFVCQVFSFVLIGVGSWALNNKSNDLTGETLPSSLIVMGVFMLMLSALGAVSAWKESVSGLAAYLTMMIVVSIILFSVGVAVSVKRKEAGTYIEQARWRRCTRMVTNGRVKRHLQLTLLFLFYPLHVLIHFLMLFCCVSACMLFRCVCDVRCMMCDE